jgi:hypothetical protein
MKPLLENDEIVKKIRPHLDLIMKPLLALMKVIDVDGLVHLLLKIITLFKRDIYFYAIEVCELLSKAYTQLMEANDQ